MTPAAFLNHVDRRVNPRNLSDREARIEIYRRGLNQQFCNLNERERRFLKRLNK